MQIRMSQIPHLCGVYHIDQFFLTRYPLHLNKHLYEDKYGEFVDQSGIYLVNLFTDGLHQNLSLSQYLKSAKFLSSYSKVEVLDDYLSFLDVTKSFIYSLMLISKFKVLTNNQYFFDFIEAK